jgi:hypothetical protein
VVDPGRPHRGDATGEQPAPSSGTRAPARHHGNPTSHPAIERSDEVRTRGRRNRAESGTPLVGA